MTPDAPSTLAEDKTDVLLYIGPKYDEQVDVLELGPPPVRPAAADVPYLLSASQSATWNANRRRRC